MIELLPQNREDVQLHLKRLGWIEPEERLQNLSPAGQGNMNRTLRAELEERSLILKQAVPFVARYPSIPAPVERLQTEATFYRSLTPELARFTPTLLGEDRANNLLCLEDLGSQGDCLDLYQGGDLPLAPLVDWLSALHEMDGPLLANRAMRELNHTHIFELPISSENPVDLSPELTRLQETWTRDQILQRRARELGQLYLANEGQSLLHGDYYPGSWLRQGRQLKIIDPEFAFTGPPEFDVGVLMAHLVMSHRDPSPVLDLYHRPLDSHLTWAFASLEVIRRLLGVAQLPLSTDEATRLDWLHQAHARLCAC